jgi:hypothetical protein
MPFIHIPTPTFAFAFTCCFCLLLQQTLTHAYAHVLVTAEWRQTWPFPCHVRVCLVFTSYKYHWSVGERKSAILTSF